MTDLEVEANAGRLLDVVANLPSLDPAATIYVVEPWECDAQAVVADEPEAGGLPDEAERVGAKYFLEVFIADEVLEGWRTSLEGPPSPQEQCERLIRYAIYDA